jgi:hypothetical protein
LSGLKIKSLFGSNKLNRVKEKSGKEGLKWLINNEVNFIN